jgi:hypothetical protein
VLSSLTKVPVADANRKDRMVSLRLTEKDYRRLLKVCRTEGVPTLSELARIALHQLQNNRPKVLGPEAAKLRLLDAESRLDRLEAAVRSLRRGRIRRS